MVSGSLEFGAGLLIVLLTLSDIFASIVIPGPNKGFLRIAVRVRSVVLPFWRHLSRTRGQGRRQRLSNSFAPLVFFLTFATWIGLLLIGYGLMFQASMTSFAPPLARFDQALYVAGSSLLTLGVSEVDATGHARWLILWAALSGFGVITAAFTFILQVQSSLHQRESGVLTLSGLAGKPPSGIVLLETFAVLNLQADLKGFFKEWRDWSAAILHSHVSFPVLVYFHSVDAESDWLSALHAVLDAATIMMELTDETSAGTAALMHRAGSRTVSHLCDLLDLAAEDADIPTADALAGLSDRLEKAGYRTRGPAAFDAAHFAKVRADYAGRLASLSRHLGAEQTFLLPK